MKNLLAAVTLLLALLTFSSTSSIHIKVQESPVANIDYNGYIDFIKMATITGNNTYQLADDFIGPVYVPITAYSCEGCQAAYIACRLLVFDITICETAYESCQAIFC